MSRIDGFLNRNSTEVRQVTTTDFVGDKSALDVNLLGSITVASSSIILANLNEYGEATLLAAQTADVVSYTVPVAKVLSLYRIEFSGENIATFEVRFDAVTQSKRHTYFGGPLGGEFQFEGLEVGAGEVVTLRVENFRGSSGLFAGRILGVLSDV